MEESTKFVPGTIVQHFKRTLLSESELQEKPLMYLYEIIGNAIDTETETPVTVYRALYGDRQLYTRPTKMFLSVVDHEKYPQVSQKHRFEIVK